MAAGAELALGAVQAILKLAGAPALAVDGKWGPRTSRSYSAASAAVKKTANAAHESLTGETIESTYLAPSEPKPLTGRELFDATVVPELVRAAKEAGLRPSAVVAQIAHESGWGASGLAVRSNNFAGLKFNSVSYYPGRPVGSQTYVTTEYVGGKPQRVSDGFAVFDSPGHFADVYVWYLLDSNSAYRYAGIKDARSDREFFEILKRGGYATDPAYVNSLLAMSRSVLNRYGEQVA